MPRGASRCRRTRDRRRARAHAVPVKLIVSVDGLHPKVLVAAGQHIAALVGKGDGVPAVGAVLLLLLGFGRRGGFARRILLLAGEHALEQ